MTSRESMVIAAGAAVGLLVGVSWPTPAPSRAPPERPALPQPREPEQCEDPALDRAIERLETQLETARALVTIERTRATQREGDLQPWPPDADPRLHETALTSAVRAAASASGFELAELDCAEFPCIITLTKVGDLSVTTGSSLADSEPFTDALGPHLDGLSTALAMAAYLRPHDRYVASFAWTDRPLDTPAAKRRLEFRLTTQHMAVAE